MLTSLFIIAIFVLSVDSFVSATVVGFLANKKEFSQLFRVQSILGIFCAAMLWLGMMIGSSLYGLFTQWASWYAATILFMLALKLLYDGIKMHKQRQTLNPLDKKGMLAIAAYISINNFFTGLAFGLLEIQNSMIWYAFIFYIIAASLGYSAGFKLKKLISLRIAIFTSIIIFLLAIVISIKF